MTTRRDFFDFVKNRSPKYRHTQTNESIDWRREKLLNREFVVLESLESAIASKLVGIPYAIIGGHAVIWHGHPRTTADVDILVRTSDLDAVVHSLGLQDVKPLAIGGYSGTTADGMPVDVAAVDQPWVDEALDSSEATPHGQMISSPFLILMKLWASRGGHDDMDMIHVLKRMDDAQTAEARRLVASYLPNEVEDLESVISMKDYV